MKLSAIFKKLFGNPAAAGFLAVMLSVCQASGVVYVRQTDKLVTLGNDRLEVSISVADGTIRQLLNKEDQVDYCNQIAGSVWPASNVPIGERIGGVAVHDELKKVLYSDLETGSKVSPFKVEETPEGVVCAFEKTFDGAEFLLQERFSMKNDHLRWEVTAVKLTGGDRSLKMVQFTPLPTWGYSCWAPIAEAPFSSNPWEPFQVNFGQVDGGPVGNTNWRTVIPMLVFYNSRDKNALCLVNPFEIPAVRIRYRNSIGIREDFHWNSRNYSMSELPYLQVISEYLGLRESGNAQTGLLITIQPANWRPSLGWVYQQYREYFDPAPGFEAFDGNYVIDHPYPDNSSQQQALERFKSYHDDQFVRWWEMHGHFPKYGEMIPPKSLKEWVCGSHARPGYTDSRKKIASHATATKEAGVGCFIYYNITESEWWYARDKYPADIARDENGNTIPAYKGTSYPDSQACWLMNADPGTKFGSDLAAQAEEMVKAYPDIAGFFWDVYGRSYRFDFAHDDGITMVNNKPAYFPVFMYQRMMEQHVGPLLHGSGRYITCNKPTMIQVCKGIDGVMAMENTPAELKPEWLVAQSYLGLNRHVMILDGNSWQHPERLFLNCLRYGFFHSAVSTQPEGARNPEAIRQREKAGELLKAYLPLIERFKGKKWIFHPKALSLPEMTDGNIFRLADGSVMVVMVSIWRELYNIPGTAPDLELTCRLPDAQEFKKFTLVQPDLGRSVQISPSARENDSLRFKIAEHGKASVILLER